MFGVYRVGCKGLGFRVGVQGFVSSGFAPEFPHSQPYEAIRKKRRRQPVRMRVWVWGVQGSGL